MDRTAFARQLEADGFAETMTVTREAGGMLDTHAHPFEARALVLQGELVIRVDGRPQRYATGDVFHLQAHCPHEETYGSHGVTYLVGRK